MTLTEICPGGGGVGGGDVGGGITLLEELEQPARITTATLSIHDAVRKVELLVRQTVAHVTVKS